MGIPGVYDNMKGFFRAQNPEKYGGNPRNIVFRSSYEFKAFRMLDLDPTVLKWSSEEIVVPYLSPVDGRIHRYFPDLYVEKKRPDGRVDKLMCEIKPASQAVQPKVQARKKPTKKYLNEVVTWGKNSAKWKAAQNFCSDRGWKFVILTEKEIGLRNG